MVVFRNNRATSHSQGNDITDLNANSSIWDGYAVNCCSTSATNVTANIRRFAGGDNTHSFEQYLPDCHFNPCNGKEQYNCPKECAFNNGTCEMTTCTRLHQESTCFFNCSGFFDLNSSKLVCVIDPCIVHSAQTECDHDTECVWSRWVSMDGAITNPEPSCHSHECTPLNIERNCSSNPACILYKDKCIRDKCHNATNRGNTCPVDCEEMMTCTGLSYSLSCRPGPCTRQLIETDYESCSAGCQMNSLGRCEVDWCVSVLNETDCNIGDCVWTSGKYSHVCSIFSCNTRTPNFDINRTGSCMIMPNMSCADDCYVSSDVSCAAVCGQHAVEERPSSGVCSYTPCASRTPVLVDNNGINGSSDGSAVHTDIYNCSARGDSGDVVCFYFAEGEGDDEAGTKADTTKCVRECPMNYESEWVYDEDGNVSRLFCSPTPCPLRTPNPHCNLSHESHCFSFDGHCYTGCPFHTSSASLPLERRYHCEAQNCSLRTPDLADGLCRLDSTEECYRMTGTSSSCMSECGSHALAKKPQAGVCSYTPCTSRTPIPVGPSGGSSDGDDSMHTDIYNCSARGDSGDSVCFYFAEGEGDDGKRTEADTTKCVRECPMNYESEWVYDEDGKVSRLFCSPTPCPLRTPNPHCNLSRDSADYNCCVIDNGCSETCPQNSPPSKQQNGDNVSWWVFVVAVSAVVVVVSVVGVIVYLNVSKKKKNKGSRAVEDVNGAGTWGDSSGGARGDTKGMEKGVSAINKADTPLDELDSFQDILTTTDHSNMSPTEHSDMSQTEQSLFSAASETSIRRSKLSKEKKRTKACTKTMANVDSNTDIHSDTSDTIPSDARSVQLSTKSSSSEKKKNLKKDNAHPHDSSTRTHTRTSNGRGESEGGHVKSNGHKQHRKEKKGDSTKQSRIKHHHNTK